jgi:hypothetical protein
MGYGHGPYGHGPYGHGSIPEAIRVFATRVFQSKPYGAIRSFSVNAFEASRTILPKIYSAIREAQSE